MKKLINYFNVFFIGIILTNNLSCKKDVEKVPVENMIPELITTPVSLITRTTATGGAEVTFSRGGVVTEKGICWSINPNPTIADSKTMDGQGTDKYRSSITGLNVNTTYYVRGYATNSYGTGYGNCVTFKTLEPINYGADVSDKDGNIYKTVIIGAQTWMIENLKTTHYNNGDLIAIASSCNSFQGEPTPQYQMAFNNGSDSIYGLYYTWFAINDNRGVCPTGYHIPSYTEWTTLVTDLGGEYVAGGKLKATSLWCSDGHAWPANDNASGFTALPAGSCGGVSSAGCFGSFWSSTENGSGRAIVFGLSFDASRLDFSNEGESEALSVRCIKD